MVMIVWKLDLQLPMQSVPIATNVASSNPAHVEEYSIQHYVISSGEVNNIQHYVMNFVSDLWQVGGSLQALTPFSSSHCSLPAQTESVRDEKKK